MWQRIKNIFLAKRVHEAVATVFGLGYLPVAPGTWGSIAGLVMCLLLYENDALYLAVFAALFVVGGISAGKIEGSDGVKDPSYVVVDEFACIFLVYFFVPFKAVYVILGFIFYRLFDIFKPPPIRWIERSTGEWGIMFDDAVAAIYANILLQVLKLVLP